MKRILAFVLIMAVMLSFTSVFAADDSVKDGFAQAMSTHYQSGAIKMDLTLNMGGTLFEQDEELKQISDIINDFKIAYDINVNGNETQTKVKGSGVMEITSAFLTELSGEMTDTFEYTMWFDMDISDMENPKYYVIVQEPVYGNYMLVEAGEVYADMFKLLQESNLTDADVMLDLTKKLFAGVDADIEFANKKYTLTMTDKQLKEAIAKVYKNLLGILGEYGVSQEEIDLVNEDIIPVMTQLATVQLFDKDKGLVINCEVDENNLCTGMELEFNIDTNIYDIVKIFASDEIDGENRDDWNIKFGIQEKMQYDELPDDFTVEYPVLSPENCDGFMSYYAEYLFEEADINTPVTVNYEGNEIVFDEPPILLADRTMVPIRALANAIGITDIEYDEESEKIILKDGTTEIVMYVNSQYAYLNGELKKFDVPAVENNGRTYIPARAVSEFFNKNVDYTDLAENGGFGLVVNITD